MEEITLLFQNNNRIDKNKRLFALNLSNMLGHSISKYNNLIYFRFRMDFYQDSQFTFDDLYLIMSNFYQMCVKKNKSDKNGKNVNCFASIDLVVDIEMTNEAMESSMIEKLYQLLFEWLQNALIEFNIYCSQRSNNFNSQLVKNKLETFFNKEKFDKCDTKWKEKLVDMRNSNKKVHALSLKYPQFVAFVDRDKICVTNAYASLKQQR